MGGLWCPCRSICKRPDTTVALTPPKLSSSRLWGGLTA